VFIRPSLALFALAGALIGASVAARAAAPYPLPTAPAADAGQTQAGAPAHPRRNRFRAALAQLDLSDAQRSQIRTMMQSFRTARKSATPMTRRQLVTNIEGILTPGQRTQLQTLMRHRRRSTNGAPGGAVTATPSPA
jgi:Spy/CpxP family protein refolding chaperone